MSIRQWISNRRKKQPEWEQVLVDLNSINADRASKAGLALTKIADESHVPELYALLQEPNFFIRESAADPLARLEGVRALPALLQALTRGSQQGHDDDTLRSIIVGLLKAHRSEAAPMLLEILDNDVATTRSNAAWALDYVSSAISAEPLLKALRDAAPDVRSAAAGSLCNFEENPQVVDELIRVLQDSDEQVRASAAMSLGFLDDKRAVPALRDALRDPSDKVRCFAALALEDLDVKV